MTADEDFWDDILAHLKQGVLIPIVGPEILRVEDGGRATTLSRLIGERLAGRYKLPGWTDDSTLNDAVRAYIAANGRERAERLYRVVNDIVGEIGSVPPDALKRLAAIRDLRLFVSTTFDSLLARALNQVRFAGEPRTRELWFSPNQSTDEQQKNARPPAGHEAVVFKLFGEVSSTPQYALHEEDVLEWLHALLTEQARLPEWLAHQLKQQPLLFVGCEISDWLGRFFVRLASAHRLSLTNKQFFIVGTATARYPSLKDFFVTHCGATTVQVLEVDPTEFVAELHQRWQQRNPQASVDGSADSASPAPHGTIFISYVREDAANARRLADAIARLGGDVWLDERRLQPGDRWEDEILTSIRREVRLFIPVVSQHTETRDEGYVFKEWREAVARSMGIPRRRFIVPIVVDAEYDGNPTRYRQVPKEFLDFNFGRAPAGEPDQQLVATLTEEIRAMRRKDAA
jgi:hypothetical protein